MSCLHLVIMEPREFGQRFKAARAAAGRTQQEVARACGKTRGAVSQWESGLVNDVDARALAAAADYMGVTLDYLLGRSESPPQARVPSDIDTEDWQILTHDQREAVTAEIRKLAEHNRKLLQLLRERKPS